MEAVYSRGTIAISLDASQPSFRFYASGGPPAYRLSQLMYATDNPAILLMQCTLPVCLTRRCDDGLAHCEASLLSGRRLTSNRI